MKRTDPYYKDLTAGLDKWCYHSDPPLSSIPHVIMPCLPDMLQRILVAIGRKGIPWNTTCLWDGSPEDEYSGTILQQWRTPEFQRKLSREAWNAMGDGVFVFDAYTTAEKFRELDEQCERLVTPERYLLAHIDTFRWFFCSVSSEFSAALFAVRTVDAPMVEAVREKFDHLKVPCTRFIRRQDHEVLEYDS